MSDWLQNERSKLSGFIKEIDPDGKTVYIPKAAIRNLKVKRQMAKKTAPDHRPYVYRLGYNHVIGQFAGSEDYPAYSGSSLNRKTQKKKVISKKPAEPIVRTFSARSKAKVKDKATAFFRAMGTNKTFMTLTFIDDLPHKLAVEILNKFLTVLRKEKKELEYLWVAEAQEENNMRIHFHMLVNLRINIRRFNALWVLQQYNAGLRGKRIDGSNISIEEIKARYDYDTAPGAKGKAKGGEGVQAVLNPLDVEKAYGINGLAYYLTKYITKQKKAEFGCLVWHCSRKVSRLFTRQVVGPSTFRFMQSFANYKVDYKTGECFPVKVISKQFFAMIFVNNKKIALPGLAQMEKINKWLIKDFEPDKIPNLTDYLYRKVWHNEKDKEIYTAVAFA